MNIRTKALIAAIASSSWLVSPALSQLTVTEFALTDSQVTLTLGGTVASPAPPTAPSILILQMDGGSTSDWVSGSGTDGNTANTGQSGGLMVDGVSDSGAANVGDYSGNNRGDRILIPFTGGFVATDPGSGTITLTFPSGTFHSFSSGQTFSLFWGVSTGAADYASGTPQATGFSQSFDFGDAPNSYDTNLASGARHSVIGPFLGTLRDSESDGQAGAAADGDDTDGTDDEDGAVFNPTTFDKNTAVNNSIDLTIGGAEAAYRIWIDFDADGAFANPGELAASGTGGPGTVNVPISIPSGADTSNPKFARIRLFDLENIVESPEGEAAGGEVEDYPISIADTTIVDLISFNASADQAGTVEIDWVTGSEISTAGFNIVRTTEVPSGADAYETATVNDQLIPSKGNSVEGADYSFSDTPGYGRFLYQLEDLEIGGAVTRHVARRVEINPSLAIQHTTTGQLQLRFPNPSGWNHEVQVGELGQNGSVAWGTLPDAPHNSGSITFDVNEGSRESFLFRVVATEQN